MTATPAPVVVDLGQNPLLGFALSALDHLFTVWGAGWLVGAVVTARWLAKDGRWRTLLRQARALLRRGRTLATLEDTLAGIRQEVAGVHTVVTGHLAESELIKQGLAGQIHEVNTRLDDLLRIGRGIQHEVLNNGGTSLKDSSHRIERALGLPEPTLHSGTGPIPLPLPPATPQGAAA